MARRHSDWLWQAESDLDQARASRADGRFEWACFAAQQAAEKAARAVHELRHVEARGHSVWKLLEGLEAGDRPPGDLIEAAKELDRHYLPSRYPNMHPQGAPRDLYRAEDADRAVEIAQRVVQHARRLIAQG